MPKPFTIDLDRLNWDDYMALERLADDKDSRRSDLLPFVAKAVGVEADEFTANVTTRQFAKLCKEFWRQYFGTDDAKN